VLRGKGASRRTRELTRRALLLRSDSASCSSSASGPEIVVAEVPSICSFIFIFVSSIRATSLTSSNLFSLLPSPKPLEPLLLLPSPRTPNLVSNPLPPLPPPPQPSSTDPPPNELLPPNLPPPNTTSIDPSPVELLPPPPPATLSRSRLRRQERSLSRRREREPKLLPRLPVRQRRR